MGFRSLTALLLAFLMLLGTAPVGVFAQEPVSNKDEQYYGDYLNIDGERIPIDDERIINVVPVSLPRTRTSMPPVTRIAAVRGDFNREPVVHMGSSRVSAQRYVVEIGGTTYEAFCADPALPGPESTGAVYELTGPGSQQLLNVLRYGFPINPYFSDRAIVPDNEDLMWWAYITRLAVAMANNPNRTFTGNQTAIDQARDLVNGTSFWQRDFDNTRPAIMVNGVRWAEDLGNLISESATEAQSETFSLSYYRRTTNDQNRFRFEWASGTPAGAQLFVNGNLVATAPTNSNDVFHGDVDFQIRMPNQHEFRNQEAKVYLIGINNAYAGRVWVMQNPNNRDGWQDIVFYIPYMRASAVFSFDTTEIPTPSPTPSPSPTPTPPPRDPITAPPPSVRIQKICAITRENIPGALMRIEGRSSFQMVTGDGQIWEIDNRGIDINVVLTEDHTLPYVPAPTEDGRPPVSFELEDGVLTIHNIPWGYYRVQEERAPDGFSLLPQHTAYSFWVLPPNVIVNTIDGGPDGDSESSNVEFIIDEDENVNSILITFENYPYGEIVVYKFCYISGQPLNGAHIRIQGYGPEGNPGGRPIDRTAVTGQDGPGRIVFRDLPAGSYTVYELYSPPGFILDRSARAVPVTWGQTEARGTANIVTFYNVPMSYLEVIKICANTSARLSDAVFELRDPTTGETWIGTTTSGSVILGQGPNGNELMPGRTLILREISAPPGFVLDSTPIEIVLSPGSNQQIVRNFENPSLTIIKRCMDTGTLLDGAVFSVTFENGQTLPGTFTSGDDGPGTVIIPWTLLEGNLERTLIITEEIPPPGFHLANPNWQRVTMRAGEHNQVIFENRRMPTITIRKLDAITGTPIQNAEFTIEKLDAPGQGMLTGNPFRTNVNGEIVLPFQHAGVFRIVERRAAQNYWLDPNEQNRSWVVHVRPNEDYLLIAENTLLPSLVVTKFNALTSRPVPLTHFRVDFEVPNSGNVQHIGNFVTNQQGQIILPFVQSGWYRITETRPAPGMSLNINNSYRVFLAPGQHTYQLMRDGLIPSMFNNLAQPGNPTGTNPPDIPEQREQLPPAENPNNPQATPPPPASGPEYPDFDLDNIEIVSDPEIVALFTDGITVTSGDAWSTGYGVWNWPLNSIVIKKSDATNGRMLAGATFDLIHVSTGESGTRGTVIGTFTTNFSGIVVITGLLPGAFVVEEVIPPSNYMLSINNRQHVFLRPDGFSIVETHFSNYPYGSLLVTLRCEVTGQPIQNGEFRVTTSDGTVIGTGNGLFRTNQDGYFLIPNLPPNSYVVAQLTAPDGFELGSVVVPQTINVRPDGQTYRLEFTNRPVSSLIIRKIDSYDNSPITGTRFRVYRQNNEFIGEFLTDNQGLITIPGLLGWFTVHEIDVPHGWAHDLQTVRTVEVRPHAPTLVTFYSPRLGSLTIEAVDEAGLPLAGATFRVNRQNGELVGTHTTGISGVINISNLTSGWYFVEATAAPTGHIIGEEGRSVEVLPNTAAHTRFVFPRLSVLTIEKVCEAGNPLANAEFTLRRPNGELIARVTTNNSGTASIPGLEPNVYILYESRPPQGFVVTELARTIEFSPGQNRTERFVNARLATFVIHKICGDTSESLPGVVFEITTLSGERVRNPAGGFEFITDNAGKIRLPELPSGVYVVVETRPLPGFSNAAPITFTVGQGRDYIITVRNYRLAQLTIRKVNSLTNAPLEGVVFEISRPDGTRLINPATGFHEFISDSRGLIHLPAVPDGRFYLHEVRPLPGFLVDQEVIPFNIDSSSRQREQLLTVPNTPASGMLITVTCAQSQRPLGNIEIEVRHADGRLVTGQILDGNQPGTPANSPQIAPNGNFITDSTGRINLNHLSPGVYHVRVVQSLQGYQANTSVYTATVIAGRQAVVEIELVPLAGFRLQKLCSISRNPIYNVEFMVFDSNNRVVGVFYTDNMGIIDFSAILAPGRYTIRETRPAPGFSRDDVPRTVEFIAGRVTEIVWYNVPIAGQLQIRKISGDDNQHNGLPAGTPLAGAIFEIFEARTGNLVDRIVSNDRGMAVSRPLPLGRYIAREVAAPAFYMINPQEIHFEIEHESQIVRVNFPNFSANMGVHIRKVGPQEAMQGHNIFYEITAVRNESSTPLADFFWRDVLPTTAVRADRLITGTYSHSLRYRVMARTSRGNEIVVADNLSTLRNNVIELRPVHLGLAANEYITEIILLFGQVPAGFTSVERPRIYVDVLPESHTFLPNGMMFANKVDAGGRIPGTNEWVIGNSTTATTIFNPRRIPQSGW